jgi:hypothetical protein
MWVLTRWPHPPDGSEGKSNRVAPSSGADFAVMADTSLEGTAFHLRHEIIHNPQFRESPKTQEEAAPVSLSGGSVWQGAVSFSSDHEPGVKQDKHWAQTTPTRGSRAEAGRS